MFLFCKYNKVSFHIEVVIPSKLINFLFPIDWDEERRGEDGLEPTSVGRAKRVHKFNFKYHLFILLT